MFDVIDTRSGPFKVTHTTDATDATFPSKIPTVTAPTGDGVLDMGMSGTTPGATAPNGLLLVPVGTGANNAVLTGVRVIAWRRVPGNGTTLKDLWVPIILVEVAAVFGNVNGVANSALGSSYFFMDTITIVTGNANVSHEIISPVGDVIASLIVDAKGAEKVEVTVDLGASATGFNCLAARV